MKEKAIDFSKGILIGIANIIPGFSGGIMAVAFNVYDRIIDALDACFSHPIKTFKQIWAIGLGAVFGILLCIFGINTLLSYFPIPTILFFTGLIIGSIPSIYEKVRSDTFSWYRLMVFLLGALLILLVMLFSIFLSNQTAQVSKFGNEGTAKILLTLFFLGLLLSPTIIIPGISGSLILIVFGYYRFILSFITRFLKSLLLFDKLVFFETLGFVLSLSAGILFGLIVLSKLVKQLLKRHPKTLYSLILGILCATPFAIIYQIDYQTIEREHIFFQVFFGILFLALGVISSALAIRYEKKQQKSLHFQNTSQNT